MLSEYTACQNTVETALLKCLQGECAQRELLDAMRYSLLAGGKRIRPVLLLKFCEAVGGSSRSALRAACGIEMLHTYSLIHDDLPCMDNDDLRRGKPTCHKVFGETYALLAGDALQSAAFREVLSADAPADRRAAMALTLAEASGEDGMCGGQYLDLFGELHPEQMDEERLRLVHALKTGALLRAACVMGVQCGGGTPEQLRAAAEYAENIGIAFQIRDDVLDCISTEEELGKNIGSDAAEGKVTFATVFGIEECDALVRAYTEKAKAAIRDRFGDTAFLEWLADYLACRTK